MSAHVHGYVDEPELLQALANATTSQPAQAHVLVAMVLNDAELDEALTLHSRMPCPAMWVVHHKGRTAVLGATAVRKRLREQGYMDTKVCAVSERLTAIRFTKPACAARHGAVKVI
jgi:hypothetical protein